MLVTNYTDLRKNLSSKMDEVLLSHSPMIITREAKKPVVMMSLEDFNGYEETLYLMRSPVNKERILSGIKDLKNGKSKKRKLIITD